MRSKTVRVLLLAICCMLVFGGIIASALIPYSTYTYSVNGRRQISPDAYVPLTVISSSSIKKGLEEGKNEMATQLYGENWADISNLSDVCVDKLGYVYLVDKDTNRIICLDEKYNLRLIISTFTNHMGVPDSFSSPTGVYVSDTEILVADTEKMRIVIFDKVGNFKLIVPEPSSDIFPETCIYKPIAVTTNSAGTIYVVSSAVNYGVISLNRDGSFNAFIGPQKVTYSTWQLIRRWFMTEKQIKAQPRFVSVEYNNITIDDDGFLYVTTAAIAEATQQSAINNKDKSDKYAPVKKLNPSGKDVMMRNGFYPPSGEVSVSSRASSNYSMFGASTIVDVALGPNGMWSIIDKKRSKTFTYDNNGNLLFAFGDKGDQIGLNQNLVALAYQGTNLLLADSTSNVVTVYKRTAYGDLLAAALQNTEDQNYSEAVKYYISILQHNNNYDAAYVGIAESLYRDSNFVDSMSYYKYAYDTAGFSKAYAEYRKAWVEDWILVVPAVVIVFFLAWSIFLKYAKKQNIKNRVYKEKRTIKEELLFAFHLILHPFDGYWDLKHEKRGGVRGATIILLTTILVFIYQAVGRGYLYNQYGLSVDYFDQILAVVVPLFLWVTANWCLTTLFDGEGTFKDIYI
ncbi:MAG: hypothetical protein PHW77_05340 [Eubacteriales bacterium]|nr:hypothetical protein [Eubacteriales bacterium]